MAWVCQPRRSALPGLDEARIKTANEPELSEMLMPLWGDKMGSAKSREARSVRWFFAALSDFNGQIQARDIVSFLAEAAAGARGDTRWLDRLLPPNAMRNALKACSRQKIASIPEENPPLVTCSIGSATFPPPAEGAVHRREDVGLSQDEARLLETNGVLFRENDHYWIPEIYRHGLNFKAAAAPGGEHRQPGTPPQRLVPRGSSADRQRRSHRRGRRLEGGHRRSSGRGHHYDQVRTRLAREVEPTTGERPRRLHRAPG